MALREQRPAYDGTLMRGYITVPSRVAPQDFCILSQQKDLGQDFFVIRKCPGNVTSYNHQEQYMQVTVVKKCQQLIAAASKRQR